MLSRAGLLRLGMFCQVKACCGRLGEVRSGVAGGVRRSWFRHGSAGRIMAGKVRYVAFRSVMLRYGRQG